MPIKPENRHRYPTDWPAVRERILRRAVSRGETGGVADGTRTHDDQNHKRNGRRDGIADQRLAICSTAQGRVRLRQRRGNRRQARATARRKVEMNDQKPTPTGVAKYPPDGYYHETEEPCICTPTCAPACKGECGCRACHDAYQDQQSVDWE